MHHALLLAVALQLEPSPPYQGEPATLTITTQGETGPLRVDIDSAAMLRRVPDGATVERVESDLQLTWQRAPEQARVELVLVAKQSTRLEVTALSGTSKATLRADPLRRDPPPMPANHVFLLALAGFALSLLIWPTFRLMWRHSRTVGVMAAIGGTVMCFVFVKMWWRDYAATADYRQGSCVVTDRMVEYQGHERSKRFYSVMVAVELDGQPRIAGDSDRSNSTEVDGEAYMKLRRFETGKAYPCWWSVRDRNEVLLEPRRGAINRTVFFTVAAFLLAILPGWMRPGFPPRRRR
jgi:hypothetical protein